MHGSRNSCRTFRAPIAAAVLVASLLVGALAENAFSTNGMTDLGTLGGGSSGATAINDLGQVVGVSYTAAGHQHAFLWSNGVMTDLGTLGGSVSKAYDINNSGQVVGSSFTAYDDEIHAFLWSNGVMTDLGTLGGYQSWAYAINDSGQVVGQAAPPPPNEYSWYGRAFRWSNGSMIDLGSLGSADLFSSAGDVNEAGQVVGYAPTSGNVAHHACLWSNGVITDVGPDGENSSDAVAINNAGQIIVESNALGTFLWSNGVLTNLGLITATAINDAGVMVGMLDNHATVWDNGVTTDLGTLGGSTSGASDINASGQIVGEAATADGRSHAFLTSGVQATFFCDRQVDLLLSPPVLLSRSHEGPARVCADGADAGIVTVHFPLPPGISNVRLRIKEDPGASSPWVYGQFMVPVVYAPDSLGCRYIHPSEPPPAGADSLKVTVEVFDTGSGSVLFSTPLSIFRTPVVMVHGIWSDSGKFVEMANAMTSSGLYPPELVAVADYQTTNALFFHYNNQVVPSAISTALANVRSAGFGAAAVDVIGHSMGGLLTRLYVQDAWPDAPRFRHDIARFVPLNSPHLGSQCANVLIDESKSYHGLLVKLLTAAGADPTKGGASDLCVNSAAIVSRLNGSSLNRSTVPTHIIATVGDLASRGAFVGGYDLIYYIVALMEPAGSLNTSDVMNIVFSGDASDVIVSAASQYGGISSTFGHLVGNQTHGTSPTNSEVISDVLGVLNVSGDNASVWTRGGFSFTPLSVPVFPNPNGPRLFDSTAGAAINSVVTITSPANGTSVSPGAVIPVSVVASPGVQKVLLAAVTKSGVQSAEVAGAGGSWSFVVPQEATGSVLVEAIASGSTGFAAETSIALPIVISATLDFIEARPTGHIVEAGGQISQAAYGHYDDGITRSLVGIAGLTIQSSNPAIVNVAATDNIVAVAPGTATLTLTYQGKTATAQASVTAATTSGVEVPEATELPPGTRLLASPNPSAGWVSFRLETDVSGNAAELTVFDIGGRMVKRLSRGAAAGTVAPVFVWDGTDDRGVRVLSGVYFAKLQVGDRTAMAKFVLVN